MWIKEACKSLCISSCELFSWKIFSPFSRFIKFWHHTRLLLVWMDSLDNIKDFKSINCMHCRAYSFSCSLKYVTPTLDSSLITPGILFSHKLTVFQNIISLKVDGVSFGGVSLNAHLKTFYAAQFEKGHIQSHSSTLHFILVGFVCACVCVYKSMSFNLDYKSWTKLFASKVVIIIFGLNLTRWWEMK